MSATSTRNTLTSTALGAAAVVALLTWAFAPRPLAVEVAKVAAGRYEQAIVEDGRTRVRERYTVAAPPAGQTVIVYPPAAVADGLRVKPR